MSFISFIFVCAAIAGTSSNQKIFVDGISLTQKMGVFSAFVILAFLAGLVSLFFAGWFFVREYQMSRWKGVYWSSGASCLCCLVSFSVGASDENVVYGFGLPMTVVSWVAYGITTFLAILSAREAGQL